jgi:iron(III) transport system ATP-binding protein
LRVQMREEIRRVQRALGIMVLYVTHDQEEAMAVSDRIAVFNHGRLVQVEAPAAIYAQPRSLFVADFIGRANLIPVNLKGDDVVVPGGQHVRPARRVIAPVDERGAIPQPADGLLMVRPERLALAASDGALQGKIARVQPLGPTTRYAIDVPGLQSPIIVELGQAIPGLAEGASCGIALPAVEGTLFVRGAGP